MDFYVVLDRSGRRVAKRRRACGHVGASHRVNKEESVKWFQQKVCSLSLPLRLYEEQLKNQSRAFLLIVEV